MASNNGSRLTVFGLGFREHDNRKMQQILRHYTRLPKNPGDRTSLFVELTALAKDLNNDESSQEEIQKLTDWLKNGGDFPFELAPPPVNHENAPLTSPYRTGPRSFMPPQYPTRPMPGRGRRLDGTEIEEGEGEEIDEEVPQFHAPLIPGRGRRLDGTEIEEDEANDDSEEEPEDEGELEGVHVHNEHVGMDQVDIHRRPDHGLYQDDPANLASGSSNLAQENGSSTTTVESSEECPVCAETYPLSQFPATRKITDRCDHTTKACLACINYSIDITVQRGALHELACPLCPAKLGYGDVKEYATKEVFERYDYLNMKASMPESFIMCLAPGCGCGQEHEGGVGEPMMICHNCKFKTCVKHKLPWHDGQTCEEFDMDPMQIERLEEEEATAKMLAGMTRICPKCSQGVIKDIGCDHLRCRCGEEWCFVCMCSWENIIRIGPTAHASTCSYHPNRVQLRRDQLDAGQNRMMQLVHGGEVSEALAEAREELRRKRREMLRPLAAKAAEERMKKAAVEQKDMVPVEAPKKKKIKLLPAWEEGGHAKKPF